MLMTIVLCLQLLFYLFEYSSSNKLDCNNMDRSKALLLSSSRYANYELLAYAKEEITSLLKEKNVSQILFIPYALFDYDEYTEKMRKPLKQFGFDVKGIHDFPNALDALANAEAIFVGGGNTFKLLKTLHENKLVTKIQDRVKEGIPYIGTSAGTNVATINICTTNDMPIVYPPSFDGINIVPFNINPHYLEPDPNSTHKGETRDERINQYHKLPNTPPVLGLREGSLLHVNEGKITLKGFQNAKLFVRGKVPVEYKPGSDLTFLLH